MEIFEILQRLTEVNGVAGDERRAAEKAAEILADMGFQTEMCYSGCICRIGNDELPLVMIDAHIDEIGMTVTYITDDGFLKIGECGGLDPRVLPAQQVTVFGKETLKGVVASVPPHLAKDGSKTPDIKDIYIDVGLSGERARELVSPGDTVVIENPVTRLHGGRVTAKSLDNRAGAAAVIAALGLLRGKEIPVSVAAVFSAKEETGGAGARTAAYTLAPHLAIVTDVSFAAVAGDRPEECGKMGKGPMIGFSPSLSREFSDSAVNTAKRLGIPFQIEVMPGRTGTNADVIGISRRGVKTVTISVPIKHMHTPIETVDMADIENTARLIAAAVESAGDLCD